MTEPKVEKSSLDIRLISKLRWIIINPGTNMTNVELVGLVVKGVERIDGVP